MHEMKAHEKLSSRALASVGHTMLKPPLILKIEK